MSSHSKKSLRIMLCMLAISTMAFAATAFAAPANWTSADVRLVEGSAGDHGVLVEGQFPSSVALPATGVLSVPNGVVPSWVGEILGGNATTDPTAKYVATPNNGYDAIAVTLTKSRAGQVEYGDATSIVKSGQGSTATLRWTSPAAIPKVSLLIQVPQGAKMTSTGGAQLQSEANRTFYSKTFTSVKKGQPLTLTVAYTGGTTGSTTQQGAQTSNPPTSAMPSRNNMLWIALVAAVLASLGAVYLVVKQRGQAAEFVGDEDDEQGAEGEPEPEPESKPAPRRQARRKRPEPEPEDEPVDDDKPFDVDE